jgi:hypothetical protein
MLRQVRSRFVSAAAFCSALSLLTVGCSNNPLSSTETPNEPGPFEKTTPSFSVIAAGNVSEYEPNNVYSQANTIYDGYEASGKIYPIGDPDFYKITFSQKGNANFFLGDIPYGCNYDLYIYTSNGQTLLKSSMNSGTANELISNYPVEAATYYLKVAVGYNSSSTASGMYTLKVKNYVPLKPNGFTMNWKTYKSYFVSAASAAGIDPYMLAAYSANECSMDKNQFTRYKGTGTYTHPITQKVYSGVKVVNGIVYAAMGLTSAQSQYNQGYKANSFAALYDIATNLKIGAADFAKYKGSSVHDMVGRVHLPNDKSAIDRMTNYAGTGKTYWQVFVDNYNNLKGQDGIFTGFLTY